MPTNSTDQLHLPGQAAAPPGPVDMSMMYVAHHAFRRDLAAFAAAVPLTPVEDREAWRAMHDRWSRFAQVLHHHHAGEDTWIWPLLEDRVTPAEREVLAAMEAEHAEIDPTLEACGAGFAHLAEHADDDARAALAVRVVAARESLARHLAHEETESIALIQRVVTAEEWAGLERRFTEGVGIRDVLRLVPWVFHGLPAPVRERLFAAPGGRVNRLLWTLTRRRFEVQDARAFRHLA